MSLDPQGVSYRVSDTVRVAPTEDGALLVDLATNSYYSLNHTGYRAWCLLSDGGTPEAAARALGDTWTVPPQSADTHVRQLIDELVAEALLVPFDHTSKS